MTICIITAGNALEVETKRKEISDKGYTILSIKPVSLGTIYKLFAIIYSK